jgi:hypothetical protein
MILYGGQLEEVVVDCSGSSKLEESGDLKFSAAPRALNVERR